MCTCTYIQYMHVCVHTYTCILPCSLGAPGRHEGWREQTQHKVFYHKVFDLFACYIVRTILRNIDSWLDILPSQAFIIMRFRCSFQVHSTYECLICVDIEAYCMCFWAIKLPLHIAVLSQTTPTGTAWGRTREYWYQKHSTVCGGRTHFKWHACYWLGKGGYRKLLP